MTKIKDIELSNFRNFKDFKSSFNNNLNILFGENGSGKTNILEGISLIVKGRGIRNSNISNFIKNNKENFKIKANIEIKHNYFDIEIFANKINEKYKKIVKINDDASKESLDYLNQSISFLFFLPEMERLFQSSPTYRRSFIDRLIFSSRNDYNKVINKYKKLLSERIKILQSQNIDNQWLNQVDKEISKTGLDIYKSRYFQLNTINETIKELSKSNKFRFNVELKIKDNFFKSTLNFEEYLMSLNESRHLDKLNGVSKIGPHRSDIIAIIDNDYEASLLSTGQQKTVVLMILLAQCKFLVKIKKITPILLFDEICSHLDSVNRQLLLDMINSFDIQFFLTGTDKNMFSFVSTNAEFYNISKL